MNIIFNLKSIKKNLRIKDLIEYMKSEIKTDDPEYFSFRNVLKASLPKRLKDIEDDEERGGYLFEMEDKFFLSISNKTHYEILNDIFHGKILPKISKNFKREYFFELLHQSYTLISSKIDKKFYFFSCLRSLKDEDKKKFPIRLGDGLPYYELLRIFRKKPTKKQIFKLILQLNRGSQILYDDSLPDFKKKKDFEENFYKSPTGINYLTLYKNNKL